ncbi:MAG: HAD-IIIC family phosphatase [Nitrospirae bacterium]|nr:HAD-IIIC family phosphatase [Nitrospirota bacterium]
MKNLNINMLLTFLKEDMSMDDGSEIFKKNLLSILKRFTLYEEIDYEKISPLLKDVLINEFKKIQNSMNNLTIVDYIKLNILLTNNELLINELLWLSEQKFIINLSASSLIVGANRLINENPVASYNLLKAAGKKINNPIILNSAQEILKKLNKSTLLADQIKIKIAVAGNCTLDTLSNYLILGMLSYNIDADVWTVPFDQWAAQILDNNSELYRFNPSFLIIYLSSLGLTVSGTRFSFEILKLLSDCIDKISRDTSIKILMILPEPMEEENNLGLNNYSWRKNLIFEIMKRFENRVIFIDTEAFILEIGVKIWFASRYWYQAKFPCHPNALLKLGHRVALILARCIMMPIKVIAIDLDNTLWGGVVGEDGWENLRMDVYSTGGPFIRLQAFLKNLKDNGIVLVIVSKNNNEDITEVFKKRDEMLLKIDDFTLIEANWSPKSENIMNIAKKLNINLNNFCFIDDSFFEREEVRSILPEVIVPEMPQLPEDYVSFLVNTGLFYTPIQTEEDRNRSILYKTELNRKDAMQKSKEINSFLEELDIKLHAQRINDQNINRVVQLINKTNQFNLTTRRYSYEQVVRFAKDEEIFSYCYKAEDKFGDIGIVGVLLAKSAESQDCYIIDTWLLSCRAMGRTIEYGMFDHLLKWLNKKGINRLIGEIIPTKKNIPIRHLLSDIGFYNIEDKGNNSNLFEYNVSQLFEKNEFVDLLM